MYFGDWPFQSHKPNHNIKRDHIKRLLLYNQDQGKHFKYVVKIGT